MIVKNRKTYLDQGQKYKILVHNSGSEIRRQMMLGDGFRRANDV